MKVIITGATGFIGRNLAEAFNAEGLEVVATGRSERIGRELEQGGITFHPADVRDADSVRRAFEPADCLVHCAGKSGDWGKYRDFFETNVMGTRNCIPACKAHGIGRILFISTPSVYFNGRDRFGISEDEPLPERQRSAYAKTKLMAEAELKALLGEGFQVMTFRPRAVFGPYDNTFVPRILMMAQSGKFPFINGGQALVDITYVDNLTSAVRKGLDAPPEAWNQIYNISNNDPVTIRHWFTSLLAFFGKELAPKNVPVPAAKAMATLMEAASLLPFGSKRPALTRFSVGYMARSMTLSIAKAKAMLGYKPLVGNEEGFKRTAAWYGVQA
jgi:nucleoside-diphosphate-sugar epimerase